MNIRLEYSPSEGKFKQVCPERLMLKAEGYYTLCCHMPAQKATSFQKIVKEKFPCLLNPSSGTFPTLKMLKQELNEFMEAQSYHYDLVTKLNTGRFASFINS